MTRNHLLVLFVASCFLCVSLLYANNDNAEIQRGAEVVRLVRHDLSPRLRDIPPIPIIAGPKFVSRVKPLPLPVPDPNRPVRGELDPGTQLFSGALAMPAPLTSWEGVGQGFSGPQGNFTVNFAPPDTNGDVGPNHYVQTVNVALAVWNKSGTVLYGPVNINTLWSGFGGGCQTNNDGDPTVTYDQFNDRWIITQFSVSTTPYLECVAVSQTGDPTGAYYRYAYSYSNVFNDYPKLGIWRGDYFITYNMFNNGQTFAGGKMCAFEGSKLRAGLGNTMQCFNESGGGLLPADTDGSANAPVGAPAYALSFGSNTLKLFQMQVDWSNAANSTFTGPIALPVNAFTPACNGGTCITQPGTQQRLDSLADRLMYRLAYRNRNGVESFVVTHSVSVSGVSAIRWYELRTINSATINPSVFQQGTYSPDTNYRWMGSIAMDSSGNIAAGYSVSSSANNVKPSIRYAGRLISDPAGQFSQGETNLITGTGVQTQTLSRWGDYSSMNIDPIDDCTFWYTNEYLAANGTFNWHTRITSFKFPGCGNSETVPPVTSITQPSNGAIVSGTIGVNATATDNVGVVRVEFYAGANLIGTDLTGPYSINWDTTIFPNDIFALKSVAYDGAGNIGMSNVVNITVNNPGAALYDSGLKAPRCSLPSSYCDSGPDLLNGRGSVGPEPNQPNTINDSCADGNSGTYHIDESLDRLRIATNDASTLEAGKSVTITATVYCYNTQDALDLYYAPNANSPVWTLIGTQNCSGPGIAQLTAGYTLPGGALQAIRGTFRFDGSSSPCATGNYNDHDDLIFTVGVEEDETPPATSITSPINGSFVRGTTAVNATASDNIGVSKVEFYADSTLIGTDTTNPYSVNWNTTAVSNGNHTLTSKAFDAADNTGTSSSVAVTVDNSPPATSITSPTAGAEVGGTITIEANASDNSFVSNIEFYAGTTFIGSDSTSPFATQWNTTQIPNGLYNLTSKAFDAAGNATVSSSVQVTVNNGAVCSTSQLLGNPGFENFASWVLSPASGTIGLGTTELPARSGLRRARLGGKGTTNTSFIQQQISIPANACQATLSFWMRVISSETTTTLANDKIQVQILNTLNNVLKNLATYSNVKKGNKYVKYSFDVTQFKGQTIRLQFRATENGSLKTNFLIDDTALSAVTNGLATCSTTQIFPNAGFESGNINWKTNPATGVIGKATTTDPARTGSWRARLGSKGVTNTSTLFQNVTIPSNACVATLSFWERITTAETTTTLKNDKLQVQILSSTGALLKTLAVYSNLNKSAGYLQKSFNLGLFKGQTIRIRFLATENASRKTTFLIDDTALRIRQ